MPVYKGFKRGIQSWRKRRCGPRGGEAEPLSCNVNAWVTDRIVINSVNPESGNSWDAWVTDRIQFNIWTGVP